MRSAHRLSHRLFSLCAFRSTQPTPKPHRLKPVLLGSHTRLLNDIADAAGHLSGAGIEQAEIVRVRPFGAHGRIAIAQRDSSVSREIPPRRRCCASESAHSRSACGADRTGSLDKRGVSGYCYDHMDRTDVNLLGRWPGDELRIRRLIDADVEFSLRFARI